MQDQRVTGIVEKPSVTDTVSAGVYVLAPATLDLVPDGRFFDIPDLVNALLKDGRSVGAYPFGGEWLAIDRIEQLEDAGRLVAERHA